MEKLKLEQVQKDRRSIKELYRFMKRDFPTMERIPYPWVKRGFLKRGSLEAVYLSDGRERFAYIVYTVLKDIGLSNILYFAVHPEHRSAGYGSVMLSMFAQSIGCGVFLEVEDPDKAGDDAERTVRQKRISFYEKNGFCVVEGARIQHFGVNFLVMANTAMDVDDWQAFYVDFYHHVSGVKLSERFIR